MSLTKPLLAALHGQATDRPPIWLMRQAGRVLPEYRALKEKYGFWTMASNPELATQVTLQPIQRFGFDGAILFADILTPLMPLDFDIEFRPGPVMGRPYAGAQDLERIQPPPAGSLDHVRQTLQEVRKALPRQTTLLGFAGAPFTLAKYLLGSNNRDHAELRHACFGDPEAFAELTLRLADLTAAYLRLQIEAGAEAVQLFDTWAGLLDENSYRQVALPSVQRVFQRLGPEVPRIYLMGAGGHLLEAAKDSGADVHSLDWRVPLDQARQRLGFETPVQGNLDPGILLGNEMAVRQGVRRVLEQNAGRPGYVFNLGHGLLPQTPLENLTYLLEEVRNDEC